MRKHTSPIAIVKIILLLISVNVHQAAGLTREPPPMSGVTVVAASPAYMERAFQTNSAALAFLNYNALREFVPKDAATGSAIAQVAGRLMAGDGGGATFIWNPNATQSDPTDTFVIRPASWIGPGRWLMAIPPGGIDPRVRGLRCDGVTDDAPAMNNLMNVIQSVYGSATVTIAPGKTCYFGSTVTLLGGTVLQGSASPMTQAHARGLGIPNVVLAKSASLQIGSIKNLFVERAGMSNPPESMEAVLAAIHEWNSDGSIGVMAVGDDASIENSEIVGFGKCFYSDGYQRTYMRHVLMDCANGVEITRSADTIMLSELIAEPLWDYNLGVRYGIGAVNVRDKHASGYNDGQVVTMSSAGATCTTLPQLKLVVLDKSIVDAIVSDPGDCLKLPTNPVSFTGGTGKAATFDIVPLSSGWRPGIAFNFHDQVDGGQVSHLSMTGGYRTGLELSNVWEMDISHVALEAASVGIRTINCVANTKFSDLYVAGGEISVDFSHSSASDGGSCAGGTNASASVTVTNLSLGVTAATHNREMLYLGPYSSGMISNLEIAGPGFGSGSSVVIAPHTRVWQISNVAPIVSDGATIPWYSIDPTSAPFVSITSSPTNAVLNSGAPLTARCNEIIDVDDSIPPTIQLPRACPRNQDIFVKDVGGHAGSAHIKLLMPSGSTLDGKPDSMLITDHGHVHIQYDGTHATLN